MRPPSSVPRETAGPEGWPAKACWTLVVSVAFACAATLIGFVASAPALSYWLDAGRWEVEIAWQRHPATVQFHGFYDPKGERIRA